MSSIRLSLAALLAVAGILHFVSPSGFERIVPPALGDARFWVYASGAAELAVAALLSTSRTARVGGIAAVVLFVVVFPANIYAAMQGGYESFPSPLNSDAAAWLRLPLQAVLVWWAWRIYRGAAGQPVTHQN